jgi:protein-S-isoprenylcysteine O-methyltransferase Ste14
MGKRGEGWVVAQFILLTLVFFAPRAAHAAFPAPLRYLGLLALASGALAGGLGARNLGRNLSALPEPVRDGEVVQSGMYGIVRHPIYLGLILLATGWSLARSSLAGCILSVLLFFFFDAKARREERWLLERYPGYQAYREQVKRLIPWLY